MLDTALSSGQRVGGDFEVIRPLGVGGMGAVYLARQVSTGAVRALKVMRARFSSDPAFVRRFTLEARASAQIRSRHVVEVVQAGFDEALSLPWLAMEFLEGTTLDSAMERFGPPSASAARALLDQLWHAMSAAHDARLVHRDLKPENLFLSAGDGPGVPFTLKVLDFGIAKWLTGVDGAPTAQLVTPLWGAPEQSVSGAAVGPYTDVWALGLLVFWLFTGQPFWPTDRGMLALQKAIHYDPIPLASARAAEVGCTRALTPEFDAWFARCVAREPHERFEHARAAGVALQALTLAWPAPGRPWSGDIDSTGYARTRPSDPSALGEGHAASTTKPGPTAGVNTSAPMFVGGPRESVRPRARAWTLPVALGVVAAAALGAAYLGRDHRPASSAPSAAHAASAATAPVVPSEMSVIPGGERAFALDRLEVSVERYQACVAAGACTDTGSRPGVAAAAPDASFDALCNARHPERAAHPINCVDRRQARAYCAWKGKRLPTEAEWDLAARGAEGRLYPWGDQAPGSCEMAVVSGLCARQPEATRPVGSRSPQAQSPAGIADLSGNVWEWVTGDTESAGGGVLRGGGWDYPASRATTRARLIVPETQADVSHGFRCALTLAK
jgi:eukaryotic-like serine/threonine-protein kinase